MHEYHLCFNRYAWFCMLQYWIHSFVLHIIFIDFSIQMHTINAILFYILIIFHIFLLMLNLVSRSQQSIVDDSNESAVADSKRKSRTKKSKDAIENGNYCIDFSCIFYYFFSKQVCDCVTCTGLVLPLLTLRYYFLCALFNLLQTMLVSIKMLMILMMLQVVRVQARYDHAKWYWNVKISTI